ncbi:MAG: DDE-type integrase/transposase/recombinase [Anaerolineae bacterium]
MTREVQDHECQATAALGCRREAAHPRRGPTSRQTISEVCRHYQIAPGQFYAWEKQARQGTLEALRNGKRGRKGSDPTTQLHAEIGRLRTVVAELSAENLQLKDVACLRPYQVYHILGEEDLLFRRPALSPEALKRPPEPDHPDQVWHIDLMYLYIRPRWYYLVDILDGYSCFLVHWSLNLSMAADTVTLTVQEALEGLPQRRPGEPKLVHDHGSQFVSGEWRAFVEVAGVIDIKIRVAHPEPNGRLERLHRTHREEGFRKEALSEPLPLGLLSW